MAGLSFSYYFKDTLTLKKKEVRIKKTAENKQLSLFLRCKDIKTVRRWIVKQITGLTVKKCSLVKHPVTELFLSNLPSPTC